MATYEDMIQEFFALKAERKERMRAFIAQGNHTMREFNALPTEQVVSAHMEALSDQIVDRKNYENTLV